MMRGLFIFIGALVVLLSVWPSKILAQQNYWLKVLPYTDINETSRYLAYNKVVNGEVYMLTLGVKILNDQAFDFYKISKLDSNGNILWDYYYENNDATFQVGGSFTVDEFGNSYFATGDLIDPATGQSRPQLHMLDPDGNLRWRLEFLGEEYDVLFDTTNGCAPRHDGNGLLYIAQLGFSDEWVKIEVDTLGNVLSHHFFEAPVLPGQFNYGYSITVKSEANGNFLIGYQNSFGISGEHSYLTRFDSTGQVVRSHNTRKLSYELFEWGDDKIVWGVNNLSPNMGEEPMGPYLYGYDRETLDSLWAFRQTAPTLLYNDEIGAILHQGGVVGLTETNGGKLVALVRINDWLYALQQFNQSIELEWTRWVHYDEMYFDVSSGISPRWPADFLEATPDGGFIVAGTHLYQNLSSPVWGGAYEAPFLMKLDSFGCAVPGCQNDTIHNISIFTDLEEITADEQVLELSVFPNPTQDRLQLHALESSNDLLLLEIDYTIYDHSGRTLSSGLYNSTGIDVSSLKSGYYYLRLQSNKAGALTIAFLKQ